MPSGKLIVFEGIYGSGKYVVRLVNRLREALAAEKREVYEIDSPDSGRAQLMGAGDLDSSWHYGVFKADFFFELAGRARVCHVIREEMKAGKVVLCKNFTLASVAYAQLKGHDWFREGKLKPHVSRTFALEQAVEALQLMAARKVTGKVVLTANT